MFAAAALAPLVTGDARTADLADGLYLACAAVGLALVVGVAGLPSLAQGGFVAVGAIVSAHLLEHGVPTAVAGIAGGLAGAAAGGIVGVAFAHLPRAGFAAATWIVSWLIAFAADSLTWVLGGSQGIVVAGGPSPGEHYELALGLTALAALGYTALARGPFGLRLAAARDRDAGARALRVPARRLRATAVAASGAVAGLTGALAVQLAGVADPSSYGPYLSFKLFVVVLLGGALAPLGAPAGVLVLAALSVAADALGSLEHVATSRSHALLAAVLLLGVVSLGWEGLVRPVRARRRARRRAAAPPGRPRPGRRRPDEALRRAHGGRRRRTRRCAGLDHGVDRPERLGEDDGAPPARRGGRAGRGSGGGRRRGSSDAAGDRRLPHPHAARARPRRVGAPAAARVVLPHALRDAEHACRGRLVRRRRDRAARALRPPRRRAGRRAHGRRSACADARGGIRDRCSGPARRRADRRRVGRRGRAHRRVCCAGSAPTGSRWSSSSTTSPVVRSLADRVIVLDAGRVIADGTPEQVAVNERVRAAYLGRQSLFPTVGGA